MPKKNVSVIVTVLNESKAIDALLNALAQQTVLPQEVIITDGGSSDETVAQIEAWQKSHRDAGFKVKVFVAKGSRSVGRNAGIELAKNEWIAMTDAGCIPDHNWLEELLKKSEFEMVAGYYRGDAGTRFQEAVIPFFLVMPDRVDPTHFLPATRSMLIKKSVWEDLGRFDETLADNEDYAFARKAEAVGILIGFAQKAVVTWQPPQNRAVFFRTIFRFARGDAYAAAWRPKIVSIYLRYAVGVLVLFLLWWPWNMLLATLGIIMYGSWAVLKNKKYAPNAWHLLPSLQIIADQAVMAGTVIGVLNRLHDQRT